MDENIEERKDLEVVSGDGSNLDISPVYDHLEVGKPKSADKKPTNIIIPKETSSDTKKEESNDDEKKEEEND